MTRGHTVTPDNHGVYASRCDFCSEPIRLEYSGAIGARVIAACSHYDFARTWTAGTHELMIYFRRD